MSYDDPSLQELIVRALTGRDHQAKESLAQAAANDPELKNFCDELEAVVQTLGGSADWRQRMPSAELAAKIRQTVLARLPSAPPRFRTVLLDLETGRRRTLRRVIGGIVAGAAVLSFLIWFSQQREKDHGALKLAGTTVFEAALNAQGLQVWEQHGSLRLVTDPHGLCLEGADEALSLCLKKGFEANRPLAFNVKVHVPTFEDSSSLIVFLADAAEAPQPTFNDRARPARALTLEFARDGLLLYGPDHALLQSRPLPGTSAQAYRLRLEHLGLNWRVLVNDEIFFAGLASQPLQGPIHPGVRVAGPKKSEICFNALRVER